MSAQVLTFPHYNPRRNLPPEVGTKRREANYVGAFERAFLASDASYGVGGRHFALNGYGIADFIWLNGRGRPPTGTGDQDLVAAILSEGSRNVLTAFELKIKDWRKALQQAYRYSYFADRAVVVLPPETAQRARSELDLFGSMAIGLWSFDTSTGRIRKILNPKRKEARSATARAKAVDLIRQRSRSRRAAQRA